MSQKVWSVQAVEVAQRAYTLNFNLFSDPDWSLLEALEKETPTGVVHLHWSNHHGRGNWNLITQPYRRTTVCKTARCRIVTITPHGGEHEACDISRQRYEDAIGTYFNNKGLKDLRRNDVQNALAAAKRRDAELQDLIAAPFGPWPTSEGYKYRLYYGPRRGEEMRALDEAWQEAVTQ